MTRVPPTRLSPRGAGREGGEGGSERACSRWWWWVVVEIAMVLVVMVVVALTAVVVVVVVVHPLNKSISPRPARRPPDVPLALLSSLRRCATLGNRNFEERDEHNHRR